jgi:succinate-semialdehyde dehydrogenase/glutarate-semialdehyde dehydrogenase
MAADHTHVLHPALAQSVSELPADSSPGSELPVDSSPGSESPADVKPRPTSASGLDGALVARLVARVAAGPGAERVAVDSPLTGTRLAELPVSTPADVEAAVARSREAQEVWAQRSAGDRAAVLLRVHDIVLERRSEGLDVVQSESGKARVHAFEELADVALTARWYARRGPRLLRDVRRAGLVPGLTSVRHVRHPKGVVAVIAPWNYPLTIAVSDALPALLAGNAVVVKPAQITPLAALWAADVLSDAGLPEGLFQVVHGAGAVIGTALIDRCDYVCFTGSTDSGRLVAQRAGSRLIGASLELGGKNPLYVAEDADLDRAAEAAVRDCFSNAGQLCVAIERMILHEEVWTAWIGCGSALAWTSRRTWEAWSAPVIWSRSTALSGTPSRPGRGC